MEGRATSDLLDTEQAGPTAIRGSVLRVGGYLAGVAMSVVSAALLLRYLGPGDFGRYATIVSLLTIIGGITEAGMTNIGLREWTVLRGSARTRLLENLLGIRTVLTALGVVLGIAFGAIAGYNAALLGGVALGGAGLLAQVCQGTYQVPLQSELRLGVVTSLELARQAATVASIVVLVAVGAALLPFFAVPILVGVLSTALTVPIVRRRIRLLPAFDLPEWRRLLAVTLPYGLATAAGLLYAYLGVVLTSLIASEVQTGYYAASFRVFMVVTAIPGLLVSSTFPILARAASADRDRLAYALQRLLDVALVFGAGLALLVAVGAPVAIDVIAGSDFEPAAGVLRIHGAALLSTFLAAISSYTLLALGRYRALLVVNAVALLVNAGLTLALVPALGAEGAAIATLCGETILALGAGVAVLAGSDSLRISGAVLKPVLGAVVAGLGVALLLRIPAAPRTVAAVFAYGAVVVALGGIPSELREALGPGLRRRAR